MHPARLKKLLRKIADEDASIRRLSAEALANDEWVCFSALEALTRFKDESPLASVPALLKSPSQTVRCAAFEALLTINAVLFLSRIDEYNDDIRDRVVPYRSHLNSGAP